jgi:hypothetical protein
MPPLQALAALHGLYVMLFLPPVLWVCRHSSPWQLRRIGLSLFLTGLLGYEVILAHTLLVWLPEAPQVLRPYLLHRIVFMVATLGDVTLKQCVPVLQFTVAGVVCWIIGWRRQAKALAS